MALTKLTKNLIDGTFGTEWVSTIQTSNFTAEAAKGYFVNTTASTITINLPAGVVGTEIVIQDYAGTFATNEVLLNASGSEKIQGSAIQGQITTNNATATLVYQDATKGWTSQDVTLVPQTTNVEYILIAGGASGGQGSTRGGGGAGGLATGTQAFASSNSISITIGAGAASSSNGEGVDGFDSTITGTITATASKGLGGASSQTGGNAGSPGFAGGSGATAGGISWYMDGGGGGLGAAGQNAANNTNDPHDGANGGDGINTYQTWATATSTGDNGYFGGGGGSYGWSRYTANNYTHWVSTTGVGGQGGGGDAIPADLTTTTAMRGAANTGGGSGGGGGNGPDANRLGGSGICILRYSGAQAGTGGTIVTTGGYTYHTFTQSGTFTRT